MNESDTKQDAARWPRFIVPWVAFNAVGWALNFPVEALIPYLWFIFVPALAFAFGCVQWAALRRVTPWTSLWIPATAVGWIAGYVLSLIAGAVLIGPDPEASLGVVFVYRLYSGTVEGACLWGCIGVMQWLMVVRPPGWSSWRPAVWWIPGSLLAGGLAGLVGAVGVWMLYGEAPSSWSALPVDGFIEGGVYAVLTAFVLRLFV